MPFQAPTPIPDPLGGKGPSLDPVKNWCDAHKTLCGAGHGIKSVFGGNRGCGRGVPGPQDPVWPWGWVYRNTDWLRKDWCEGGKNCDSPRREMTKWVVNRYTKVFGSAEASKLKNQDVIDMVVHYGAIGKRIYPPNLPCGETKWGQLADSIRKAALDGLEADLRSGAFKLVRGSSPADNPGGEPMPGPNTGGGNLPGSGARPSLAGFNGWIALVALGALLLIGIRK